MAFVATFAVRCSFLMEKLTYILHPDETDFRWSRCFWVWVIAVLIVSCINTVSIALAAGGCPGGGSSRHGAEEHHWLLPAVERDGLKRRGTQGVGSAFGWSLHSLPLALSLSLSLSHFNALSVSASPGEKKLKRWRVRIKDGAGSVRRKEKSEEHPRPPTQEGLKEATGWNHSV